MVFFLVFFFTFVFKILVYIHFFYKEQFSQLPAFNHLKIERFRFIRRQTPTFLAGCFEETILQRDTLKICGTPPKSSTETPKNQHFVLHDLEREIKSRFTELS